MFTLINKDNTCCFSGYRPEKLPWGGNETAAACLDLKERIYSATDEVYADGIRHYICGMARGCDMYFADAVIRLKKKHPGVTLEAALPYPGQALRWAEAERERHGAILQECALVTPVSEKYTAGCMKKRNRYMVNNACILISAYDGQAGGTSFTLAYAEKKNLEIRVLHP